MRRFKAAILVLAQSLPHLGFYNATKLALAFLVGGEFRIRLAGHPGQLVVRGRTSDPSMFRAFFGRGIDLTELGTPRTIIDAGANVGYFSALLANAFPQSVILAIEPETKNFELLRRNVAPYPNVKPVCAALWPRSEAVRIKNPGASAISFQVESGNPSSRENDVEIQGKTVEELLDAHEIQTLDLLKIDIEGGEKPLFAERTEWLARVNTLLIEMHGDAWRTVFDELSKFDYHCQESSIGGLLIALKSDAKES